MSAPTPFNVRSWFDVQVALLRRKQVRKSAKAERRIGRTPAGTDYGQRAIHLAEHSVQCACAARDAHTALVDAVGGLPLTKTPYGLLVREEDFEAVRRALFLAKGEEAPAAQGEGGVL